MEFGLNRRLFCILIAPFFLLVAFVACNSSDSDSPGNNNPAYTETTCTGTVDDSTQNPDGSAARIISHLVGSPTYYNTGTRRLANNDGVNMAYMVHAPAGTPQALLVLIAGGNMNAYLNGDINTGEVGSSGGNFLVRSAHLFAAQGYRVITIDRPTDYPDWSGAYSSVFDAYRISVNHAVDLSRVINNDKSIGGHNLPVVICGTSRGAISAVNQHFLADAIALSSPVTAGSGTPLGSGATVPADITLPAHVLWHALDGCIVTTPADSMALLDDFADVVGDELDGGFADTVVDNPCGAFDYHGFLGIESCAVNTTADWIASLTFDATRPETSAEVSRVTTPIDPDQVVDIDLSTVVTPAVGGELTFSLPHATTSLNGTASISGSTVTYTPPAGVSGTRDTFVYVVTEAGGGKAQNRVVVQIN